MANNNINNNPDLNKQMQNLFLNFKNDIINIIQFQNNKTDSRLKKLEKDIIEINSTNINRSVSNNYESNIKNINNNPTNILSQSQLILFQNNNKKVIIIIII